MESTMKRIIAFCFAAGAFLFLPLALNARQQEAPRPRAPALTDEDVTRPGLVRPATGDNITKTTGTGTAVRNPRTVLEKCLGKMSDVSSVRTRMEATTSTGKRDLLIESVKPDRMRVVAPDSEMIFVEGKLYSRTEGGNWEAREMPPGGAQSVAGVDFVRFLKQLLGKSRVRIAGQVLGSESLDGIETIAYEFTISDNSETGTIQVSVGKEDGFMRKLFINGGPVAVRAWFTDINESISIEPPL
jgi:hypothetical protein